MSISVDRIDIRLYRWQNAIFKDETKNKSNQRGSIPVPIIKCHEYFYTQREIYRFSIWYRAARIKPYDEIHISYAHDHDGPHYNYWFRLIAFLCMYSESIKLLLSQRVHSIVRSSVTLSSLRPMLILHLRLYIALLREYIYLGNELEVKESNFTSMRRRFKGSIKIRE